MILIKDLAFPAQNASSLAIEQGMPISSHINEDVYILRVCLQNWQAIHTCWKSVWLPVDTLNGGNGRWPLSFCILSMNQSGRAGFTSLPMTSKTTPSHDCQVLPVPNGLRWCQSYLWGIAFDFCVILGAYSFYDHQKTSTGKILKLELRKLVAKLWFGWLDLRRKYKINYVYITCGSFELYKRPCNLRL